MASYMSGTLLRICMFYKKSRNYKNNTVYLLTLFRNALVRNGAQIICFHLHFYT